MQQEPAIALALGGRAWTYGAVTMSLLGFVGILGILVDAGWATGQALLGAAVAGALLYIAGVLVQQQLHRSRRQTP
ncbi:MAG TPA: hypothetical protein VGR28_06960 [Candidatus Thermoplasmatota archaeon]|jgi:hypothetical protein|nr:hypothetical protein [Candidatus Thermoplasmatota archaeon]